MNAVPTWRLTHDGEFTIASDPAQVADWLPIGRLTGRAGRARLTVRAEAMGIPVPGAPPVLRLLDTSAWLERGRLLLRNQAGTADGAVDLEALTGEIGGSSSSPLDPLLTIAAALILGRLGRVLVHAAAAVAPDGKAWLLAGDTHSGKSTTLATLARAGWRWQADDQAVVRLDGGVLMVEGWPRRINLDGGYASREITSRRVTVDPVPVVGVPFEGEAPLGGVLFPTVESAARTHVDGISQADGFAALIRQAPWLLADPAAVPMLTSVATQLAGGPRAVLRLGRDSYADAAPLLEVLAPLIDRS